MKERPLIASVDSRQPASALVRRADWRFLLPAPENGKFRRLFLPEGDGRLGDWLVDAGFAETWSRELASNERADVAAVLDGAQVDLHQLASQLTRGGVLYLEWSRLRRSRISMTPARLRRVLHQAGFTVNGIYAIRPSFRSAELFLPLDAPHALKWYVRSLYSAPTPKQRLLEGMLTTTTRLNSDRFAAVAPFVAIVATLGTPETTRPAIFQCPGIASFLSAEPQEPLVPLMLTDAGNRVALLPFTRCGQEPGLVVKVPKLPSFNDRTVNEQATLERVHEMLSPSLRRSLPRPLGIASAGDIAVSVESFVPGASMMRSSGRWGTSMQSRVEDLRLATAWICDLHAQTTVDMPTWGYAEYRTWFEPMLDVFRATYHATDQEEHLFAKLRQQSDLLTGRRIPVVWQHRDFNVWNVFRNGRSVSVIDWEGGRPGLPLCDLLHFATHWNDLAHGATSTQERASRFEALFCTNELDDYTTVIHDMIRSYVDRLQIDSGFVPMLLVHTWLELLLRRLKQLQDMGEKRMGTRENNQYFGYLALLASHADRIFDGSR